MSDSRRITQMICALLLIGVFIFSQQVVAVEPNDFENLSDMARNAGEVRIIVTMIPATLPGRASMEKLEYDRLLASVVSRRQDSVINTLSAGSIITEPRRFPFTAQFAVTVTAEGLNALMNNPQVIDIDEDIAEPPILDQSVPHIFPDRSTSSYSGKGWSVVILDTGVDKSHSFLTGKVVSEACYSTNATSTDPIFTSNSVCPGGVLSSTGIDSGVPCDLSISTCSHGTHVGGIAAGEGASFSGVARDAKLIAIQVFSRFSNTELCGNTPCVLSWRSDQISALNRVYELRTAYDISSVNMSLGSGDYDTACDGDPRKVIIDTLRNAGIATIIASGNEGYSDAVNAPGCISTAITVGATNDTVDTRASFSNNSVQLDLYAPGVSIYSSVPGGGFQSWNGTSMAAPHVAGAWAVMRQQLPTYSVDQIEGLFKGSGVTVTSDTIGRQRIELTEAPGEVASSIFIPIYINILKK